MSKVFTSMELFNTSDSHLCRKYRGLLLPNVNYGAINKSNASMGKSLFKKHLDQSMVHHPRYSYPSYPTRCYPTIKDYRAAGLGSVCAAVPTKSTAAAPQSRPSPPPARAAPVRAAPVRAAPVRAAPVREPTPPREPTPEPVKEPTPPPQEIIIPAFKDVASLETFVSQNTNLSDDTIVKLQKKDGSMQEKTYGSLKQKLEKLQAKMKPASAPAPAAVPTGPIEIPTFKNFDQLEVFMKDGEAKGYVDSQIIRLVSPGKPAKEKTFGKLREKYNKMKASQ